VLRLSTPLGSKQRLVDVCFTLSRKIESCFSWNLSELSFLRLVGAMGGIEMATDDLTSKFAKNVSDTAQNARAKLDETTSEAKDAVGEVRDNFRDALDQSIEERPYTTLLLALGLGFVIGTMWRR
jgi:ElaB/YqjD/DUF883 family membrane-anchored ribosome-binding protein